jgi:hypothetical protein
LTKGGFLLQLFGRWQTTQLVLFPFSIIYCQFSCNRFSPLYCHSTFGA